MAIVEAPSTNLWGVLLGRGPEGPLPADADLWEQVRTRLNPAKARPRLREGVEFVELTSLRSGPYVMLRSPDQRDSAYARLTLEEAELARRMDGQKTVAQLVGEFAKMTGRLAPDQVQRVVADLAGGRMLEELPLDAFVRVRKLRIGPWPVRLGRVLLRAATGRRMVIAHPDRLVGWAYKLGGRLLFTRVGTALTALTAVFGFALFARTFTRGSQSAFLFEDSYLLGALLLIGLNVAGLLFHEAGHALGTKHAGRRVGAVGFLMFFGIPSAFVDTTDMWMASRKHRLIASGAGPGFALTFAGAAQGVGMLFPPFAPIAFKLAFAWYLNTLFNLNPLMTLDGYYLFMDWLEIPGLRSKGIGFTVAAVKRPRILFQKRTGEARLIAYYSGCAALWMIVMAGMLWGMFKQRYLSMGKALWGTGLAAQLLMLVFAFVLVSPIAFALGRLVGRIPARLRARWRRRDHTADFPFRLAELRETRLGSLPEDALAELARDATWLVPRRGTAVVAAGAPVPGVIAVVNGALEARRPGDPSAHIRARAGEGELVGVASVLQGTPSSLAWTAVGTRLLVIPGSVFARVVGPRIRKSPPTDRAEIENLLDASPAFVGLSEEARHAVIARAKPVDVSPGQRFRVKEGYALLVGAGTIRLLPTNLVSFPRDGVSNETKFGEEGAEEVRGGGLIGPPTGEPIEAEALTRARVWSIAAVGGLGPFLGDAAERQTQLISHVSPVADAHGDGFAAPLVLPWGSPPPDPADAEAADDALTKGLKRVSVALLLLALLALLFAQSPGHAWGETPSDTAILKVEEGTIDAVIDGRIEVLQKGDEVVVAEDDVIEVRRRSLGEVTFRGGGTALLCPYTDVTVGPLESHGLDPAEPSGDLTQRAGKVISDTTPENDDFAPLELAATLILDPGDPQGPSGPQSGEDADPPVPPKTALVENEGEADFSTSLAEVEVARGVVLLDGEQVPADPGPLDCGSGGHGVPVLSTTDTTTTTIAPTAVPTTTTTTTQVTTSTKRKPRTTTTTTATTVPPSSDSTTTTAAPPDTTTTPPPDTTTTTRAPETTTTTAAVTTTTCRRIPGGSFVCG
ncbi:MAG: cyclic nucleotide-binding protein [Actinobacteria bacterium]|nr:cyclic nucleotide-binding protein [Actinomycetota bacterium]